MRGPLSPESTEAFILAGGQSRRMGRDKSVLPLAGRSLLEWVQGAVAELGLEATIIREDRVSGCGPLGGVSTAGHLSRAARLVILSCDMPFVSVDIIQRLVATVGTLGGSAICQLERNWCLPFIFERNQLAVLDEYLENGERSIGGLLESIPCQRVRMATEDEWRFHNVNTVEDLAQAERWLSRVQSAS